ncbi:hypothetical protein BCR44DRAFT_1277322 [Catenaria anguillulae PL171]|uniref:Uncharacterized protein n=1 Tax=Catenaria anguillulae PL171 TaxID=765915 RepID=A0A1Y2H9K8_9FUNG|nr:hypothetical protein BCR44DRAFT_1277322 [Catenaria anguillulae PL171]
MHFHPTIHNRPFLALSALPLAHPHTVPQCLFEKGSENTPGWPPVQTLHLPRPLYCRGALFSVRPLIPRRILLQRTTLTPSTTH